LIVVTRPDRLLTTGEAANAIGLSRRTLSKYAREGPLRPAVTMPGLRPTYWWDPTRRAGVSAQGRSERGNCG
jgi:hypothetical protein